VPSRRAVATAALVVVVLLVGTVGWAYAQFRSIERVELGEVLAADNGTNYLIVGSDSREGIDPGDPNAGAMLGDDTVGGPGRSDTILVLRVDGDGARMLSVPRDLFVTISETGQRSRINAAFTGGPQRLIATLRDQLQLPIHHYVEVDFVSFASMVDALGGITIDFAHPAFDTHSGLDVAEAGSQTLGGTQALAYVRSRFFTEVIDGRKVPQGTGDIGRVERQQKFLAALTDEISSTRNPITLARVADTLSDGMRIDSDLGFLEALGLLRRMQGLEPASNPLPTSNFTTSAGAQVLRLAPGADEVLARFGSPGAAIR
jgi:LCP family protein required for cell wall assembly